MANSVNTSSGMRADSVTQIPEQQQVSAPSIDEVPDALFPNQILKHLTPDDLINLALTNKTNLARVKLEYDWSAKKINEALEKIDKQISAVEPSNPAPQALDTAAQASDTAAQASTIAAPTPKNAAVAELDIEKFAPSLQVLKEKISRISVSDRIQLSEKLLVLTARLDALRKPVLADRARAEASNDASAVECQDANIRKLNQMADQLQSLAIEATLRDAKPEQPNVALKNLIKQSFDDHDRRFDDCFTAILPNSNCLEMVARALPLLPNQVHSKTKAAAANSIRYTLKPVFGTVDLLGFGNRMYGETPFDRFQRKVLRGLLGAVYSPQKKVFDRLMSLLSQLISDPNTIQGQRPYASAWQHLIKNSACLKLKRQLKLGAEYLQRLNLPCLNMEPIVQADFGAMLELVGFLIRLEKQKQQLLLNQPSTSENGTLVKSIEELQTKACNQFATASAFLTLQQKQALKQEMVSGLSTLDSNGLLKEKFESIKRNFLR